MTELVEKKTTFDIEEVKLIKNLKCRPKYRVATDSELILFSKVCKESGLSPFKNQIYAIFRKNKQGEEVMSIQTGIDGYRSIAERTGKYLGSDDPVLKFDEKNNLVSATVTVWKLVNGQKCSFSSTAHYDEYRSDRPETLWQKMPKLMLSKCAEALALRKCFPNELSGLYTQEEMGQAEEVDIGEIAFVEEARPEKTGPVIVDSPLCCEKPMIISKYQSADDKKKYGENSPWYCLSCKKKLKRD